MGSGGSVEAAEAAPAPHVRVVLQGLQVGDLSVEILDTPNLADQLTYATP
jgi:hypothetical protein